MRTREEAIQKVKDDTDPRIERLTAKEKAQAEELEITRIALREEVNEQTVRIQRINEYYDAAEKVAAPPSEVSGGG